MLSSGSVLNGVITIANEWSGGWIVAGATFVASAGSYPHLVVTDTWTTDVFGAVSMLMPGVLLDWRLLVGAGVLAAILRRDYDDRRSVRASRVERSRHLPGDYLIAEPGGSLTNAITIAATPQAIWPWLVQMGAGNRAGWYSYDVLDNGRQPSATSVVPGLQDIKVGTVFPALPGVTDGFQVLAL